MSARRSPAVCRLGISELETRLGVCRRTLARWCGAGTFPQPHYVGQARKWLLADVEAWERTKVSHQAPARPGLSVAARPSPEAP